MGALLPAPGKARRLLPRLAAPLLALALAASPALALRQGDSGAAVKRLQERLRALGYLDAPATGFYGPLTAAAVRRFQAEHRLGVDGVAGPLTLAALDKAAAPKARRTGPRTHTVQAGETLSRIAALYGLSTSALARANGIADPDRIRAGQRLVIPAREEQGKARTAAAPRAAAPRRDAPPIPPPDVRAPLEPPEAAPAAVPGREGGRIALTFDDGPGPATRAILDVLNRKGVRATFFIVGAAAEREPDLVRAMAAAGHQVENHSWSHKAFTALTQRQMAQEIRRTSDLVRTLTGRPTRYFRPPGGAMDQAVFSAAGAAGHRIILWTNIGAPDLPYPGASGLVSRLRRAARDGAIIMLHGDAATTAEALPAVIDALRADGFRFVTLDALISGR